MAQLTKDMDDTAANLPATADSGKPPAGKPRPGKTDPGKPQPGAAPRTGFFTIYKKGQGKWTRLGTVFGAALIGLLFTRFFYANIPVWYGAAAATPAQGGWGWPSTVNLAGVDWTVANLVSLSVSVLFLISFALITHYLTNKASHAEFLIATDSEMKKVNWATRAELLGSTRVVIIFLILVGLFLFVADIVFSWIFYIIGVIKVSPFQ